MDEETIFTAALAMDSADRRSAYLDEACAGRPEVRRKVEELLSAHVQAGHFLDEAAAAWNAHLPTSDYPPAAEQPTTVIGPYKLLEQIGEGGMGLVFMAEQTQPVRRRVALKVLKPGLDTRQVVARFEAERQALAMMDHPNIARVFDGGTTETGRPYFVMELVKGVPITDFCDQLRLSTRQRLELFATVCAAVQHAHTKGIIHRDLKPSNVLVTLHDTAAVPKVIDFGIAKATGQQLTDKTLFTGFAQMVGTPLYMSPEQAGLSSLDVDTRSDVYSLGVLLYELLTGTTPFDREALKEVGYDELRRIIREDEPPRPSARLSTLRAQALSTVAEQRGIEPRKLNRQLRGELDWIVMRALEKDRSRRYETASALAADVQRYLADEPVQACPPSVGYRLRKFARRNKRALAMAALLGVVVLAAVASIAGILGWTARDRSVRQAKLNTQVELALHEAGQARELALTQTGNAPQWESGLAAAASALKRAEGMARQEEAALDRDLQEQLERLKATLDADQMDLRFASRIDDIRLERSEFDVARNRHKTHVAFPELRHAFKTYYGINIGATPPLEAVSVLQKRPRPIQEHMVAALYLSWAWAPADEPQARAWLTSVLKLADADPWRKQARQAVAARDWAALEDLITQDMARQPAVFLLLVAEQVPLEASTRVNLMRRIQQAYPGDFWANLHLAAVLSLCTPPRWDEAFPYYTAALALRPQNPAMYLHLSHVAWGKGDSRGRIEACRRAIAVNPKYLAAHYNLGVALQENGDVEGAIAAYRDAVALNADCVWSLTNLGVALMERNDLDGAMAVFRDAIVADPKAVGPHINLGRALLRRGHVDEAIKELRKAVEIDPNLFECHANLGNALLARGLPKDAISSYRKSIRITPKNALIHYNLGRALDKAGRLDEALAAYREAARLKPDYAPARTALALALNNKAWRMAAGQASAADAVRAVALAKEAVSLLPTEGIFWHTLGMTHYRAGQWKEAVTALDSASDAGKGGGVGWFFLAMAHHRLGEKAQARKWYDRAVEWMDRNNPNDEALRRFRAEAEELLEIKQE